MGASLSLEAESTAFWIAFAALFAAFVVGACAAVVMVFASVMKRHRGDLLRVEPPQLVAGVRSEYSHAVAAGGRAAETDSTSPANATSPSLGISLAPRNIDVAGKLVLLSRLSRFKGTELDVLVYRGGRTDAFPVARMVAEALETAGWSVRIWNTSTAPSARGLLVQTRRGADATVQEPGVKLMLALQEAGLGARAFQPFEPDDVSNNASGEAWTKDMTAPIRLLIGSS
jgi:hypothetical protein